MNGKTQAKLIELNVEQLTILLKGNVLKLDKDGLRISLSMSQEEIEAVCEEIAATAGTEGKDDEDEEEDGGGSVA